VLAEIRAGLGWKLYQRMAPEVVSPEKSEPGAAAKGPDVSSSKCPAQDLMLDVGWWVYKDLIEPGFHTEMTGDPFG
jgi:hypothetical protein